MSIFATNKKSADLQSGSQTVRVVGEAQVNDGEPWTVDGGHVVETGKKFVRYDLGQVDRVGVYVILPSGVPMTWEMVQKRVEQARGKYHKDDPFIPNEMLKATGADFSDL